MSSCTAVAGTENYGLTWHRVGAPPSGASQIRFLSARNGWAFGPDLYATHDGGARWRTLSLPGRVIDLSAVGNRAFAVVASRSGAIALYSARATTADNWQPVPGATSAAPEQPGGLQLTGQYGYLLASGGLLAGPVTGGTWHHVPASATTPACLRGPGLALLAPALDGRVFLACGTPLTSYVSADGGRTWQRLGMINVAGREVVREATAVLMAAGFGLAGYDDDHLDEVFGLLRQLRVAAGDFSPESASAARSDHRSPS